MKFIFMVKQKKYLTFCCGKKKINENKKIIKKYQLQRNNKNVGIRQTSGKDWALDSRNISFNCLDIQIYALFKYTISGNTFSLFFIISFGQSYVFKNNTTIINTSLRY